MTDLTIYQGDSIEESFTSKGVTSYAAYSGSWAILAAVGEAPKAFGSLAVAADDKSIDMIVPGSVTEDLPAGDYILAIQFKRAADGFSKEQHRTLTVSQQGIPG